MNWLSQHDHSCWLSRKESNQTNLYQHFVYASSEGFCESVHMPRLAWALVIDNSKASKSCVLVSMKFLIFLSVYLIYSEFDNLLLMKALSVLKKILFYLYPLLWLPKVIHWWNVFRNFSEISILWLIYHWNSASKYWIRQILTLGPWEIFHSFWRLLIFFKINFFKIIISEI